MNYAPPPLNDKDKAAIAALVQGASPDSLECNFDTHVFELYLGVPLDWVRFSALANGLRQAIKADAKRPQQNTDDEAPYWAPYGTCDGCQRNTRVLVRGRLQQCSNCLPKPELIPTGGDS